MNIINRIIVEDSEENICENFCEIFQKNKLNMIYGKDGVFFEIYRLMEFQYVLVNFFVG